MNDSKSKTQKKRDAQALQKLGVQLIALSSDKLDALPLSPELKEAITQAQSLKSHGALRRQTQWIGKLMRGVDAALITDTLEQLSAEEDAQTYAFHEAERWRTRLMQEGHAALTEFVRLFHPQDVQHLRVLIKKAMKEVEQGVKTGAGKALFRYVRSCLS